MHDPQVTIHLTEDDKAACAALSATDRTAFYVARLAAQLAPTLLASLANGNVLGSLSTTDRAAIDGLIAALKAVPNG